MVMRETVETVLGRVRPFLQADGGDVELVEVDERPLAYASPAGASGVRART